MCCDISYTCETVFVALRYEDTSRHIIIMKGSNWEQPVEKAISPLSVLLSLLCCCEARAWSSQSSSWERLKLHRSHGGLFWAPKESGRGQAAGSSDSFVLSAGEPLSSQHVCSLQLFTAQALCDHNGERSGRMLCATSPGECVGTPSSSQVCLVCSLDLYWWVGAATQTNSCR